MTGQYARTIADNATEEMEVKKSRFIGHAFRVTDDAEARLAIDALRKQYWNANHNCTAWRIGPRGMSQRTSDDGEPSGTAGVPMLEVLIQRDLVDVLIVVTRYFGGIKLGAGGLIRAYGSAASAAVDAAGTVERRPLHRMVAIVDHTSAGRFDNAIRAAPYALNEVEYGATGAEFAVHLEPELRQAFTDWVAEITAGQADVVDTGTFEIEVPVAPQVGGN